MIEWPEPEGAVDQCADEFVQLIIAHLKDQKGVHIETAITAAASMAGYVLLRETGIDLSGLQPGSMVLVDRVNETGPRMLSFLSELCVREGLDPSTGWTEEITEEHHPLVPGIDLVHDLRQPFMELTGKHGINPESLPKAAAIAAIKLVRLGRDVLDPDLGKAIVLWSMLSASKTVPHP